LRRGALVAVPVAVALLAELITDDEVAAAIGTSALLSGFVAFDAPAATRAAWYLAIAPAIGLAAAFGIVCGLAAVPAVAGMALVGGLGGYLVAVSPRVAICGLTTVLAFLIAEGLDLDLDDAPAALALGIAGALLQAAWALVLAAVLRDGVEPLHVRRSIRDASRRLRGGLSLSDAALRHALRFGIALAVGVAIYRAVDLGSHGYWVPLTILFVLKPEPGETHRRLAMRAAGTVLGLILATALAELLGGQIEVTALVLAAAAACAFALLAIEYALFTTAITVYVVLLTDSLGSPAFEAADERAVGTALGIFVAGVAFWVWGDVRARGTI
jgi:uncharacterized membrane protein YccC